MKKQITLLFILISVSYALKSQNIYPITYSDCNTSQFLLEGKEIIAKYDEQKLLEDLLKTIKAEDLSKIKGEIYFQVVVDTMGYHCCVSIKNELNSKGKKVDFKKIMDNQTKWSVPIKNETKKTVSAIIKIEFTKNEIILKRLGYNGKTGWSELSKYKMKK